MASNLTLERLKELFRYDPESGVFIRLQGRGGQKAGPVLGCLQRDGYRLIGVDYRLYLTHRLAWFYCHGRWPPEDTDHIDGDRQNNRIANLREASRSLNNQNQKRARKDNTTGRLGVSFDSTRQLSKPYRAAIVVNGSRTELGYFVTAEEAHAAYLSAKRQLHEGNTL